jgi:hypothetical protein
MAGIATHASDTDLLTIAAVVAEVRILLLRAERP